MNNENLPKYLQEKNEGIQDYVDRILVLWNEDKKKIVEKCYFKSRMFFIQAFISGIADVELKYRMLIWFNKQDSICLEDAVKIAKELHKYQQMIPGFMEYLTKVGITDDEVTRRTIIDFINEYPEEIEPFLKWFWSTRIKEHYYNQEKVPGLVEYLTRVGIPDDEATRRRIINFINKYPEEVESYLNEYLDDPVNEYVEESHSDEPNYNHYSQQKDEGYIDYLNRIESMWGNEKETVIEKNQKFFFQLFINGIRNVDVKRRTNKWYKMYKCFKIEDRICIYNILEKAQEFQKEKDNVEKAKEFQKRKRQCGKR